jgi:hypothetical protein
MGCGCGKKTAGGTAQVKDGSATKLYQVIVGSQVKGTYASEAAAKSAAAKITGAMVRPSP